MASSVSAPGSCDAVVIGAGLGGLAAAGVLARAGLKVQLFERRSSPGGAVHARRIGPYAFDSGMHTIGETGPGELLPALLEHLGAAGVCSFLPADPFYGLRFPDFAFEAPVGKEAYVDAHAAAFQGSAAGIRSFYDLCFQVHREAHELPPSLPLEMLDSAYERFRSLFRYRRASLADVLAELVPDPRAHSVCGAISTWLGLAPSRLSFLMFAQVLASYVPHPAGCRGTFETLSKAICSGIAANGGAVNLDCPVERIIVSGDGVCGVGLAGGEVTRAPVVIANADARLTLEVLLEGGPPPQLERRLRRLRPSLSAVVVYAVADVDLGALPHHTFVFDDWDLERGFGHTLAGRPAGLEIRAQSRLDDSLAPAGRHLLTLTVPTRLDADTSGYRERMTELAETVLPGLGRSVEVVAVAGPRTFEEETLCQAGALYGWELANGRTANGRLPIQTPVEGLYLAGNWTTSGGCAVKSLVSGIQAANLVLMQAGHPDGVFRPPDLPPQ